MRILALETTDTAGSVAALTDGNPLLEITLGQAQRSAQSLAPAMHALFQRVGWLPRDVQLVAVSVGPGSFTGLRIGITTAKVFAYAVGADILGINTMEVIAAAAPENTTMVSAAMDAQRGEVVAQSFARGSAGWFEPLGSQELIAAETWLTREVPADAVLSGPALLKLANRLPPGVNVLDQSCWRPRATQVGRLAARDHALGRRDDLWKLVPHYSRRSAAEEKWDARRVET